MDGTSDRPPGKAAQNWGRKDGIRAGAVSGPWRSAPRDPNAPEPQRPRAEIKAPARPKAAVAAAVTPATTPAAPVPSAAERRPARDPSAAVEARHRELDFGRARSRRMVGSLVWIGFGGAVAIGCIVLAFLFRPVGYVPPDPDMPQADATPAEVPVAVSPPPPAVVIDDARMDSAVVEAPATAAAPAADVTAPAAAAPAPDAALAGVTEVRLRVGPGFDPARQQEIVAALTRAGVPSVKVEELPFEIATSRVGYYRAADLPAAEELGKLISPVIAGGAEIGVRDYAQLLADPEPGRLDLWVGG